MSNWAIFFNILFAAGIIYLLATQLRAHPEWLKRENLSKSTTVMGVLALVLIGVVAVCVLMLRK